jgi:hypothetical protein
MTRGAWSELEKPNWRKRDALETRFKLEFGEEKKAR